MGTFQEDADQSWMAFQRWSNPDVEPAVNVLDGCNKSGQVTFHVKSESQEIGDYDDLPDTLARQGSNSARQVGLTEFEEGSCHIAKRTHFGKIAGDSSDAIVSRFNPRAVSKQDEGGRRNEPTSAFRRRYFLQSDLQPQV